MLKRIFSIIIILTLILQLLTLPVFAKDSITSLSAPTNLTAELKYREDGVPYFLLKLDIPSGVQELNENLAEDYLYYPGYACDSVTIQFDFKYADYDWNEGPSLYWNTSDNLTEFIDRGSYWEYEPFDSGDFDTTDVKREVYYFRARFVTEWGPVDSSGEVGWIDQMTYSNYSNTVMIGTPDYYTDASSWAVDEIKEAGDAGLIPDILLGKDMTKAITREEFCELAVLLYDKTAEYISTPYPTNPFSDTVNPQILKAFNLGITKGISDTAFEPTTLINREQSATMLYRTIKAIVPDGDYGITGVADFPDQAYISTWALDGAKYMSKLGIIKGDSHGNFMPKAMSEAQETIGFGMATREAAILMSVRTYKEVN